MKKWGMASVGGAQAAIPEQTMDLLLQSYSTLLHAVIELFQHSNLVENTYTRKKGRVSCQVTELKWHSHNCGRGQGHTQQREESGSQS